MDAVGDSGLISVVLPTYNRASTLPRAIASILGQGWREFELLVIDDGSSDGTAELVGAIDDPRVRYVRQPKNGGVSAARNRGVELARGEWIAFQDSDDEWLPDFLSSMRGAAQQLGEGYGLIVCCLRCPEDPFFSYGPLAGEPRALDFGARILTRLPPTNCWMARRDALLRAGLFDTGLQQFEDWELALRMSESCRVGLLNEVQQIYHRTPGSLVSDHAGYVRTLSLVLQRHAAKWAGHPRELAMYQNLVGHMACLHGSAPEGRAWFRRAIATAPRSPRPWVSLCVSYFGRGPYAWITEGFRRARFRRNAARTTEAAHAA